MEKKPSPAQGSLRSASPNGIKDDREQSEKTMNIDRIIQDDQEMLEDQHLASQGSIINTVVPEEQELGRQGAGGRAAPQARPIAYNNQQSRDATAGLASSALPGQDFKAVRLLDN